MLPSRAGTLWSLQVVHGGDHPTAQASQAGGILCDPLRRRDADPNPFSRSIAEPQDDC